jgi:6-pyruvoyltetrahydropterin/6-carboxytetrahydropterin synthase
MKPTYTSEKLFDGYSACFRQWKAETTHCKFLHGYAISFKVTFEGELDERNWVFDFGGMKRAKNLILVEHRGAQVQMAPKEFFDWLFDHTTIIAQNDPELDLFKQMDKQGIIQLRIMDNVGCERFAEFLFYTINEFLNKETKGKVQATSVTVYENQRNSATFKLA